MRPLGWRAFGKPWRFSSPESAHHLAILPVLNPNTRSFHMGLALITLSALSQPLHALVHWFHPGRRPHSQSAMPPTRTSSVCLKGTSPCAVTSIAARSKPPFQQTTSTASTAVAVSASARLHTSVHLQCAPSSIAEPGTTSRLSTRRQVRVLHPASRPEVGRMVISGRMADVCTELERMVACEAWHH